MDTLHSEHPLHDLLAASRRVAQRSVDMGANRLELLLVEVQEERERLVRSFHLALGAAALALLAGVTFTFAIMVLCWDRGAIAVLFGLAVIYAGGALYLRSRLLRWQRDWPMFGATMDQLRKDRECLAQTLR